MGLWMNYCRHQKGLAKVFPNKPLAWNLYPTIGFVVRKKKCQANYGRISNFKVVCWRSWFFGEWLNQLMFIYILQNMDNWYPQVIVILLSQYTTTNMFLIFLRYITRNWLFSQSMKERLWAPSLQNQRASKWTNFLCKTILAIGKSSL